MNIRKTTLGDLEEVKKIYEYARKFMKINNNATQWGDSKPALSQIIEDINKGKSYVCVGNAAEILGVFYYSIEEDPTYKKIDGSWLNNELYGVVHRIAVKENKKGVGSYCLNWAFNNYNNLRIDTHENNIPMKSLLLKMGFRYCGIIYLADGNPREAYQKN